MLLTKNLKNYHFLIIYLRSFFSFQIFDYDLGKSDDFLGRLRLSLIQLKETAGSQSWFPLEDVAKGKLCLEIEWLRLLAVNNDNDDSGEDRNSLGSAVLQIYVDSCKNLPSNKVGRAPSSILELQVRTHAYSSSFTLSVSFIVSFCFVSPPGERPTDSRVKRGSLLFGSCGGGGVHLPGE